MRPIIFSTLLICILMSCKSNSHEMKFPPGSGMKFDGTLAGSICFTWYPEYEIQLNDLVIGSYFEDLIVFNRKDDNTVTLILDINLPDNRLYVISNPIKLAGTPEKVIINSEVSGTVADKTSQISETIFQLKGTITNDYYTDQLYHSRLSPAPILFPTDLVITFNYKEENYDLKYKQLMIY